MDGRNRYPGAKPFRMSDSHVFYGRDDVSKELYQLVSLEPIVVLHAKSGLGKSSVINAGLMPRIVEAQEYEPHNIRFYAFTEDQDETPLSITQKTVFQQSDLLEKIRPAGDNSLWYHLKNTQLQTKDGQGLLLIFDQFEELFTHSDKRIKEFARELSEALYTTLPQRFREKRRAGFAENKNFLTDSELALLDEPLNLRLLMAIRSDRMSLMKKIKEYFPTILSADFELLALNREQAEDAILSPAYQKGDFHTAVFDYEDEAIEYVLDYLSENGTEPIESFQLQILCEYVEQHIVRKQGKTLIEKKDIANPSEILENYYLDKITSITDPEQRLAARRLIEEGFIFEEEKRRLTLYEGQIFKNFGIDKELLNQLLNTHLIRSEPGLRGGYTYELSHDTLVPPVLKAKAKRLFEERLLEEKEEEKKRNEELAILREKEETALRQAEKEKELRTAAESNEKRARQRTRLASGVSILAIILSALAFVLWGNAKKANKISITKTEEAEEAALVATNVSLVLRKKKNNPTLALRIADYNIKQQPDHPAALAAFRIVISDTRNNFFSSSFHGHTNEVSSVSFGNDGKNIATGSWDRTAIVWDLAGKELLRLKGHAAEVSAISFSPDDQSIVTGSWDKTLKLWDLNGKELIQFIGHTAEVSSVFFSPDGTKIVSGSRDETAKLWNLAGKELAEFKGHAQSIPAVSFSPNGEKILTGSRDRTARLWDLNGKELQIFVGHIEGIESVAFSPDGNRILTGSGDNTAKLWDLQGNELVSFIGHTDGIETVAFSFNGKQILTGSWDNTIKLWDVEGNELQSFLGHSNTVREIAFSPDGKSILSGSSDETAKLWQLEDYELTNFIGHDGEVSNVSFSPDGQSILTSSWDKTVKLWDLEGKELKNFEGFGAPVITSSFSPDGKSILTGNWLDEARLLTLEGEVLQNFKNVKSYNPLVPIYSVDFSPDGKNILTGRGDGITKLWDLQGQLLRDIQAQDDTRSIYSVAFSPDGKSILTGGGNDMAKLWDLAGNELKIFEGHTDKTKGVAFSPDGQYVLTGSLDETAKLWDLEGKVLRTFEGHTNQICAVAFSPDGKSVLTGSWDWTAKLWDLEGHELQSFEGHKGAITSVDFSPDGKRIATGSKDGTAKLWLLPQAFLDSKVYEFSLQELKDADVILNDDDLEKVGTE